MDGMIMTHPEAGGWRRRLEGVQEDNNNNNNNNKREGIYIGPIKYLLKLAFLTERASESSST
jgi:hypothetical protein